MITVKNIIEEYPKIGVKLPAVLGKDEFEFIKENIDLYGEDETIDEYINTFVAKLNEVVGTGTKKKKVVNKKAVSKFPKRKTKTPTKGKTMKRKTTAKPKTTTTATAKPKKVKTTKAKAEKAPDNTKYVESIDIEVALIKSFSLLHGKKKSLSQLTNLLKRINRAIIEKKIRSNSIFADDIKKVQKGLEKLIERLKSQRADAANMTIDDVEKYKEIAKSEKVFRSVTFIIRYMNLVNKPDIDTRAAKLYDDIKRAEKNGTLDNKYSQIISFIKTNLSKYDKHDMLPIPEPTLQGLSGENLGSVSIVGSVVAGLISGYMSNRMNRNRRGTVTADKLAEMKFDTIDIPRNYRKMLGQPERGGSVMVYGEPGSGKSSFAITISKDLADAGKKVLYITKEEGVNSTMKEKIVRFGATSPNIFITEDIPADLSDYYCVVFDSVQTLRLKPEDIITHKRFNNHIRIYVFQVTKDGKFRGGEDFAHNVDCVLYAENGTVSSEGQKNRFGGRGMMRIFNT